MKKNDFFTLIVKMIGIVILFGLATAAIDYFRMKSGENPIMNVKRYNEKTKIQTFRGIFYKAERKVVASPEEPLTDSSDIKYSFIVFEVNVPRQFKEEKAEYSVNTKTIDNCQEPSKLYYADKNIKVYTYCLEDIKLTVKGKEKPLIDYLKKDKNLIDELDSELSYLGLHSDRTTLMFKDTNAISKNGLTMYRCNQENINDVYIGPDGMPIQADFCTYKDDDFKFMYTIEEEPLTTKDESLKQKEVIYEDEQYRYEFDEIKSNRIFIVTPAVRGKEEKRYPLRDILNGNVLTLDELAAKGLKFNKVDKIKEQEELVKQQATENK